MQLTPEVDSKDRHKDTVNVLPHLGNENSVDFWIVLEVLQNLHSFSLCSRTIDIGSEKNTTYTNEINSRFLIHFL